jgi:hypothetical protein
LAKEDHFVAESIRELVQGWKLVRAAHGADVRARVGVIGAEAAAG